MTIEKLSTICFALLIWNTALSVAMAVMATKLDFARFEAMKAARQILEFWNEQLKEKKFVDQDGLKHFIERCDERYVRRPDDDQP